MINYLSIDFESWAYPDLPEFRNLTSEKRKFLDDGYVKHSAEEILKILAKYKTKITFFVLGELYEWYPEVIRGIAKEGHEIAYHTHRHEVLRSEEGLVDSLKNSKKFLDNFKPKGFRAPNIFLKQKYFSILENYGFQYDSSTYGPYSRRRTVNGIVELPVSSFFHLPVGSGYFIALLGKKIDWFYYQLNKKEVPVIAFIHNWQIIKPKKANFPTRSYLLRHPYYFPYTLEIVNVFEYLLKNFQFTKMKEFLK